MSLKFHLARHMQLLRRAAASLRVNGALATWRRVRSAVRGAPVAGGAAEAGRATSGAQLESPAWFDRPWVLVVDDSAPAPDRDSGSLRLHNLMRAMVAAGYRVAFVPDDGNTASTEAARLRACGIQVPSLRGARDAPGWLRRHRRTLAAAILCRHHVAGHWLPLVRAAAPQAVVVFDTVDLHYLRESREAVMRGDERLRRHADATRRREIGLVGRADITWVVSPIERGLLQDARPAADVRIVSNIVDEDVPGLPFGARRDLLFVGGLRHPPNRDAIAWLADEIFPRIHSALPDVVLHLVGSDDGAAPIAREGITCHGHVADIAPWLDGCRIALAPLRFGAGVKGKVNLSMAHGQPVVATACAIEGMHLQPGEDVLVANDADAFASEVVRLYRDEALWQRLSGNGRANVRRHFSPAAAIAAVASSLGPPRAVTPC
jgi:glycosyltransferase involved in cell wall biosynthesis